MNTTRYLTTTHHRVLLLSLILLLQPLGTSHCQFLHQLILLWALLFLHRWTIMTALATSTMKNGNLSYFLRLPF
ncbi:hypothetical protein IWX47DRAFT_869616 [Phyllosticta citricarpa]